MVIFILLRMEYNQHQERLLVPISDGKVLREITLSKNNLLNYGHITMFLMKASLTLVEHHNF